MVRTLRLTRLGALVAALVAVAGVSTACDTAFPGVSLRIATGSQNGVYNKVGGALAVAWERELGLAPSDVQVTQGSPENIGRLVDGRADVAISAADVAAQPTAGPHKVLALARIYDDYLHVVVRADSPIRSLADLKDKRVSLGTDNSGTSVIANRVLKVTGVPKYPVKADLNASVDLLREGHIDAFFWSGGLPTPRITELTTTTAIRLIDLGDQLPGIRAQFPIYNVSSIPAATYGGDTAVTTLAVPNFLLVTDAMSDDLAQGLVSGLFEARTELARANPAAQAIDVLPGIETDPVPLHPGAIRYYEDADI